MSFLQHFAMNAGWSTKLFRRTVLGAVVGVLCTASMVARGAPPHVAPHVAPHVVHHPVAPIRHNTHLHIAHERKVFVGHHLARAHMYGRWYGGWVVIHHGHGTIVGMVHDANGYAINGAPVHLVSRKGHALHTRRARHYTRTNESGTYTMLMVRPGRYRVVAAAYGAGSGSTPVHVHSGGRHEANVRLHGAVR